MNTKKTIITLIVLTAFLFIFIFIAEKVFNRSIIDQPSSGIQDDTILPVLDIKEEYEDSTYTFVGTVDLPTPCHTLESQVNMISEGIYEIEINTISPDEDTMCAQVVSPTPYRVSFEASEDIMVYVNFDGTLYELNRFIIPEGENIDTFELFIKG